MKRFITTSVALAATLLSSYAQADGYRTNTRSANVQRPPVKAVERPASTVQRSVPAMENLTATTNIPTEQIEPIKETPVRRSACRNEIAYLSADCAREGSGEFNWGTWPRSPEQDNHILPTLGVLYQVVANAERQIPEDDVIDASVSNCTITRDQGIALKRLAGTYHNMAAQAKAAYKLDPREAERELRKIHKKNRAILENHSRELLEEGGTIDIPDPCCIIYDLDTKNYEIATCENLSIKPYGLTARNISNFRTGTGKLEMAGYIAGAALGGFILGEIFGGGGGGSADVPGTAPPVIGGGGS